MTVLCRRSHHRFTFEGFPTASAHVWGLRWSPPQPQRVELQPFTWPAAVSAPRRVLLLPQARSRITSDRPGPASSARSSTVPSLSFRCRPPNACDCARIGHTCTCFARCGNWKQSSCSRRLHVPPPPLWMWAQGSSQDVKKKKKKKI